MLVIFQSCYQFTKANSSKNGLFGFLPKPGNLQKGGRGEEN